MTATFEENIQLHDQTNNEDMKFGAGFDTNIDGFDETRNRLVDELATKYEFQGVHTCSALTGEGMKQLFDYAIEQMLTMKMMEHGRKVAEKDYVGNRGSAHSSARNAPREEVKEKKPGFLASWFGGGKKRNQP